MRKTRKADAWVLGGLVATAAWFVLGVIGRFGRGYPGYDVYAQMYPNLLYTRAALEQGYGLLWTELQNCGQPHFAIVTAGLLNPVNALVYVLDPDLGLELGVFVYLLIAGTGTFLAGRALGLGRLAAFTGAVAFLLGGGMAIVGRTTQAILGSYVWLPWAAYLCERILRAPSALAGIALGCVLTFQLFAGYPQLQLFTYQWLALRFVFEVVTRPDRQLLRSAAALASGMLLAPLLGAVQLLPAFELVGESLRAAELSAEELTRGAGSGGVLEAFRIRLGFRGFGAGNLLPVMGALLAGLAFAASRLRRVASFQLLVVGLCLGLSFVDWVFELYQALPFGSLFRLPSRCLWLASFALSLAVACGVEALVQLPKTTRAGRALGSGAAMGLLAALYALSPVGFLSWEWLLLAAGGSACAAGFLIHARRPLAALVLLALLTGNLVAIAGEPEAEGKAREVDMPFSEERGVLYERRWAFELVKSRRSSQDRMYQVGRKFDYSLSEKSASVFGIPSITDYEQQTSQRYAEIFVMMLRGRQLKRLEQFRYRREPLPANRPLFDLLAARYLVIDLRRSGDLTSFDPPLHLLERRGSIAVFENPTALPRAFYVPELEVIADPRRRVARLASAEHPRLRRALIEQHPADGFLGHGPGGEGSAEIVESRGEELVVDVEASREGFLFVSDQAYPGWEATVDGVSTAIQRANHAFRVVRVPEGSSRVVFRYRPDSVRLGAAVSTLTLAALAIFAIGRRRQLATRP